MQIWPVIDMLRGQVVQAIAGNRQLYQPIQSRLIHSTVPLHVAQALRNGFGFETAYVADLDAIEHGKLNTKIWMSLPDSGLQTFWLDAGFGSLSPLAEFAELRGGADNFRPVLGLESLTSLNVVTSAIQAFGPKSVALSLDLRHSRPVCSLAEWSDCSSIEIVDHVIGLGIENLIVLDLSDIGVSKGLSTLALLEAIRKRHPNLALITGGGIRDVQDLERLSNLGIDAAIVATALHNGSLTPESVAEFLRTQRARVETKTVSIVAPATFAERKATIRAKRESDEINRVASNLIRSHNDAFARD